MNDREPNVLADPLAPLGLPAAIRAQASKLLRAISSAENLPDTLHTATRAEGLPWAWKPYVRLTRRTSKGCTWCLTVRLRSDRPN
ncbi:hypothetical protein [Pseudomonas fluorescens]|uniref:Uncharacterized protein n=1 Tax=Pseudomonas fluorescens TaxID=294 RepID=A0A5E7C1K9_PSEFL|nr:hypothetical protein [Pseudomonas fluorescens]VVN98239.1 hypothetical protein PS723_02428 [Pseudomonas fluorescens]